MDTGAPMDTAESAKVSHVLNETVKPLLGRLCCPLVFLVFP